MAKAKESEKKEKVEKSEKIDLTRIKEELKDYVDLQIKKGFNEELEKSNKRLLREKNKKIIFKNIVIIILIAIICFLGYLLYESKYLNKYFTNENNNYVIKEESKGEKTEEKKEEVVITLDDLIKKHAYLLDNYYIYENSKYLNDFYNGNLTNEIKSYITLNNISAESITKEEDYNMISEDVFKATYEKLFNDYVNVNFDYNENKIRFLNMINSYISDSLIKNEGTNIKRSIIDIKEGENIVITTVEGIVLDGKLYNILDSAEIENYNNEDLSKYASVLNKVIYTFKDEKLIKIEK